jgi:thiamine-phosphate pyrophosphorylase
MSLIAERLHGLYVITDPRLLPSDKLLEGVHAALDGGAGIVQYRNKAISRKEALAELAKLKSLTERYQAVLIVNDSIELCIESDIDGVHLGQSDDRAESARKILGPDKILGITCHNDPLLAQKALASGADYCAFGRLFESKTKPEARACSLETFRSLCQQPSRSVGIGGITAENAHTVIEAGADMVAIIDGVFGQTNIEASARAIASLF